VPDRGHLVEAAGLKYSVTAVICGFSLQSRAVMRRPGIHSNAT
jgi:hypothetical protein